MNEDAAKELVEFVGQLAQSVAVLTRGMTALMTVVTQKDEEIKELKGRVEYAEHRTYGYLRDSYMPASYMGIGGGGSGIDRTIKLLGEWKGDSS